MWKDKDELIEDINTIKNDIYNKQSKISQLKKEFNKQQSKIPEDKLDIINL